MLRYLSLIVCACAVSQAVAYSRPVAPGTSPLAGNRINLQPAVSVVVPAAPQAQYGRLAPALAPYGAPALAPVLNLVAGSVSYAQPALAPALYAAPRAPAVDSDAIALARLALSLPSAGGPIVDPIPIVPSGLAKLY